MIKYDAVCLGMLVCDILAGPVDHTVFTRDTTKASIRMATGGDAMTQAIISARLGLNTALIGKVGNDGYGAFLLESLRQEGVDSGYIRAGGSEIDTAVSIVLINSDGSRNFIASEGLNNQTLCTADLDMDAICGAKFLSYGSFGFMKELDPAVGSEVFQEARKHGATVIVDCCANVYGYSPSLILNALPNIDYFVPSEDEASAITGENDPVKIAKELTDNGCRNLVIKLGGKGCYVKGGDYEGLIPSFPVGQVADTTGAGDNFVGGLLCGLSQGLPFPQAVRFAQATAAVSIGKTGATAAVKSREQILRFLQAANK